MRNKVICALALFFGVAVAYPQNSPYNNSIFPAQSFTATAQTGAPIVLSGQSSTIGSSFASGSLTVTGLSLSTVTFAVQGSSDNGVTYVPLAVSAIGSPGTTGTTTTATGSSIYQFSLAGLTHIKIVTSGTFTATNVSFVLTASPNATISRAGSGGGGSGGMTLISDQLLLSPAASVNFSAIAGTFRHLKLIVSTTCSAAVNNDTMVIQANGDISGVYARQYLLGVGTSVIANQDVSAAQTGSPVPCATGSPNVPAAIDITFENYTSTTLSKTATIQDVYMGGATITGLTVLSMGWVWNPTVPVAITSLSFTMLGGSNFVAGSRFTLYGL